MQSTVSFMWPQWLWLLLALPLLVAAYAKMLQRRKKLSPHFAGLSGLNTLGRGGGRWRQHLPPLLFLMAIAAALLAASRPFAVIALPATQSTIVLAMDVSLSMRVTDVKPNRLVAAQEAAKAFLKDLPKSVKVAIVTFAASAQLIQPATLDREALAAAIDQFQMQRGTAIGSGIVVSLAELFPGEGIELGEMTFGNARKRGVAIDETPPALKSFVPVAPGSYESAAIVLLTDGRRTTGVDTLEAAKMAADHGVRVYSVGLGTVDGDVAGFEAWSAYIRLDEPTLKAVALATKAEYFYAGTAETLKKVYERLSSRMMIEKKEIEVSGLLALAAALLAISASALSLLWFNRIL